MGPWVGRKAGGEVAEEPVRFRELRCMLKGRKLREEDHGVGESVSNRRFNF